MKNDFKYIIIGVMIIGWSVFSWMRTRKKRTEIAEIEDDLNRYLNGFVKYDSIKKAIENNGKGWWISNENFKKLASEMKRCALDEKCRYGGVMDVMVLGNDTNERAVTIEDIKSAKIVIIGSTEGASFFNEFAKYPGRSVDEFWKKVNKNIFILGRLEQLMKKEGYSGKRFDKKVLKQLAKKYSNLELNKATEILLNIKTIQQFPG